MDITSTHRIAAHKRLEVLNYWFALEQTGKGNRLSSLQDKERYALREATYWESFPDSYSTEQVTAAQRLLRAVGDPNFDCEYDEYVASVRAVDDLMQLDVDRLFGLDK